MIILGGEGFSPVHYIKLPQNSINIKLSMVIGRKSAFLKEESLFNRMRWYHPCIAEYCSITSVKKCKILLVIRHLFDENDFTIIVSNEKACSVVNIDSHSFDRYWH